MRCVVERAEWWLWISELLWPTQHVWEACGGSGVPGTGCHCGCQELLGGVGEGSVTGAGDALHSSPGQNSALCSRLLVVKRR